MPAAKRTGGDGGFRRGNPLCAEAPPHHQSRNQSLQDTKAESQSHQRLYGQALYL